MLNPGSDENSWRRQLGYAIQEGNAQAIQLFQAQIEKEIRRRAVRDAEFGQFLSLVQFRQQQLALERQLQQDEALRATVDTIARNEGIIPPPWAEKLGGAASFQLLELLLGLKQQREQLSLRRAELSAQQKQNMLDVFKVISACGEGAPIAVAALDGDFKQAATGLLTTALSGSEFAATTALVELAARQMGVSIDLAPARMLHERYPLPQLDLTMPEQRRRAEEVQLSYAAERSRLNSPGARREDEVALAPFIVNYLGSAIKRLTQVGYPAASAMPLVRAIEKEKESGQNMVVPERRGLFGLGGETGMYGIRGVPGYGYTKEQVDAARKIAGVSQASASSASESRAVSTGLSPAKRRVIQRRLFEDDWPDNMSLEDALARVAREENVPIDTVRAMLRLGMYDMGITRTKEED